MITLSMLYLMSEWVIRLVMLVYVPQRRKPAATRTWLLLIFLLPWPGLILYAIIGRIYLPRRRLEMQSRASQTIREAQDQLEELNPLVKHEFSARWGQSATLARSLGDFYPLSGNAIELIGEYEGFVEALIRDIDAATHHVHLLFYIFTDDTIGNQVAEALVRAQRRGVQCRLLMDAVGSQQTLKTMAPRLRAEGVEVIAMLPVGLFRRNAARLDLRNHRKLVVIDGAVAYTGSQNIVDPEFIPGCPNKELVARIRGPVVMQVQAVFLADRHFECVDPLDMSDLFPPIQPLGNTPAQLVPTGPGYQREGAQELLVSLVHSAMQRVVICTPYFVPDESFLQAMRIAVLRGVEVHIVLSLRSNQMITQMAQQSYYEELLEAGVKIHLYRPGFLHAKHLTVDDCITVIGSTNVDIRSFALNSEISLVVYDAHFMEKIREVQDDYFANSDIVTAEQWGKRPFLEKISQNLARLADSLL